MARVLALLALLTVAGGVSSYEDLERFRRASAGAFSGFVNGQHYGGTYNSPDNGPTVFNRFGDVPSGPSNSRPSSSRPSGPTGPGSSGGAFAGAGSYAGSGSGSSNYPFAPNVPPFQNPIEFNDFFQKYFTSLNANLATTAQRSGHFTSSSSNIVVDFGNNKTANGTSGAFQKNLQYQQAAFNAAQNAFKATAQNRFGAAPNWQFYGPGSGAEAAFSSASYGPGGGHQAAGVYPENPSRPNVHNRFSGDDSKPAGNFGVSTSSFVSSSNVNGKKTTHKQAATTVNDNGKVTTYLVRD